MSRKGGVEKMPCINSFIDHLVVVAATLEQGARYCEERLGIRPVPGGEHLKMGTHNQLLHLGGTAYLEVIAVNPAASSPAIPRWFGMDTAKSRLRSQVSPYLATFAIATDDVLACARAAPQIGAIHEMQRGDLAWQITITEDGDLRDDGALPTVIQWPENVHPTKSLPDVGCRLRRLEVRHAAPHALQSAWRQLGLTKEDRLIARPARPGTATSITAYIETPMGICILGNAGGDAPFNSTVS
jgi:Glyoxalase-like domain